VEQLSKSFNQGDVDRILADHGTKSPGKAFVEYAQPLIDAFEDGTDGSLERALFLAQVLYKNQKPTCYKL